MAKGNFPALIDVFDYCSELSNITEIKPNIIEKIVICYFTLVVNGSITFAEANDNIENTLTDIMKENKKDNGENISLSLV